MRLRPSHAFRQKLARRLAFTVLALAAALEAGARGPEPLRIRASPALARCAAALGQAFSAKSGLPVTLDVTPSLDVAGADLLIADSTELQRLLEGGMLDERSAVNLGEIPWVMVAPAEEAAPSNLASFAARSGSMLAVLGGRAGREARAALRVPAARLNVTNAAAELQSASHALVPRSLLGSGTSYVATEVPPLLALAAPVSGAPDAAERRAFLDYLQGAEGRRVFEATGGVPRTASIRSVAELRFAQAVVDWWVCGCAFAHNSYSDPSETLGAPNAENLGAKDLYSGMMSLGQGGWVVVDMGHPIVDGPGPDIRVYQTTSSEPVTVYASNSPTGPFKLVGLMRVCGIPSDVFSNHCDFDLGNSGMASARYLRVEDGEIYPCLAGTTLTEGADIDSVASLRP